MVLYGSLILTPISHNLYGILNKVYGSKLSPLLKICQVLTSVCTIQPIISAIFTAWISVINEFQPSSKIEDVDDLKHELTNLQHIIKKVYGTIIQETSRVQSLPIAYHYPSLRISSNLSYGQYFSILYTLFQELTKTPKSK